MGEDIPHICDYISDNPMAFGSHIFLWRLRHGDYYPMHRSWNQLSEGASAHDTWAYAPFCLTTLQYLDGLLDWEILEVRKNLFGLSEHRSPDIRFQRQPLPTISNYSIEGGIAADIMPPRLQCLNTTRLTQSHNIYSRVAFSTIARLLAGQTSPAPSLSPNITFSQARLH